MSTNIEHFFPEEHLLQQLANELFKKDALHFGHPSSQPGIAGPDISTSMLTGGIAGIYNPISELDLTKPIEFLNKETYSTGNNTSIPLPNAGISPSAHEQRNSVDLRNPQTALADPHFPADNGIPGSLAGSGISPSFYFLDNNHFTQNGKTGEIGFNADLIKKDFPILSEYVNGRPLVWLDNAATTQKPRPVIDRVNYYYEHENSNVHRAAHVLAARSTDAYEGAREKVRRFLNARSANEIVFLRGTTEGINLVAGTFGEQFLKAGDEIVLSNLEHHANIVPWQQLAGKKGIKIRIIPVDDDGQIIFSEYEKLLNSNTKLVSFTHVSNALGTVTPAKQIIDAAHQVGAKVLLDGAQSVSHIRVDLQNLNPDFFVFSGHKIFGPTGIGVLYGKEELLNELPPWQGGGNMIKDVTFEKTQFHKAPGRFEAGTGNIADAIGLGAALDYVTKLGIDHINSYEHNLLKYATNLLKQVPGLRLIGTAQEKASVLSFTLKGYTNDEVGKALNEHGIAVRTGHHCAQPILRRFGLESTVRPSLAFYNTCTDIDALVNVLHRLKKK